LTQSSIARYPIPAGQASLLSHASRNNAAGIGFRYLLWIISNVKQPTPIGGGKLLSFEVCQSYLATVDGVSKWSARKGWTVAMTILRPLQLTRRAAASIGIKAHAAVKGRRHGGFILLFPKQLAEIRAAVETLRFRGLVPDLITTKRPPQLIRLRRMPTPLCTVAARCPEHNDRRPSLVLWMNRDSITGGAQCMVCQRNGKPATWAVRYGQNDATLFPARHGARIFRDLIHNNKDPNSGHGILAFDTSPAGKHYGAFLEGFFSSHGDRQLSRRVSGPVTSLLANLRWHERRSKGVVASNRAQYLSNIVCRNDIFPQLYIPQSLCSVSEMRPSVWRSRIPIHWKPCRQSWILFDLDGVSNIPDNAGHTLVDAIKNDENLSGDIAVVQTGPVGLQIWAKLRIPQANPQAWHRRHDVVDWYKATGASMITSLHNQGASGGTVDMASCAAGRFGRRPGWRLLRDGNVFRSRILCIVETNKRVEISAARERDTKPVKIHGSETGGSGGRTTPRTRLQFPARPDRSKLIPRENPCRVRVVVPQQNGRHAALILPLSKPTPLMFMEILQRPSLRFTLFGFEHYRNALGQQDIVGRPLFFINGKKLPALAASQDPHRRGRTNNNRPALSLISGVKEFEILFPSFASICMRHRQPPQLSRLPLTAQPP